MDCRRAADWLLRAEALRPGADTPIALAAHLRDCAACAEQAGRLERLEAAYRAIPVPVAAERAREAFRRRLPAPRRRLSRAGYRQGLPRWAAAAMLFLTLALGSTLLVTPGETYAATDLVERLVDWNVDLARAPTPADRARIFAGRAHALQTARQRARLPADDDDLAAVLLANGVWLAGHDDPLTAADRFSEVADHLVERMGKAVAKGNAGKTNKLAQRYGRVARHGIDANVERAQKAAAPPERKARLERIADHEARREQSLERMADRAPKSSQKAVRHALTPAHKPPKHKAPVDRDPSRPRGKAKERRSD